MSHIRVIAAAYGYKNAGADVTAIVQARLDLGHDDVIVSNEALGGDPAKGHHKQFGIVYQMTSGDGTTLALAANEGEKLELIAE